jgi:hypothetical protein
MEDVMDRTNDEPARSPAGSTDEKKPYSRPVLTRFGDIRTLTLAPSPGTFESGLGSGFRSPGEGTGGRRSRDSRDTGR